MPKIKLYIYKDDAYMMHASDFCNTYFRRPEGSLHWDFCSRDAYEQAKYYGKPCSEKELIRRGRIYRIDKAIKELVDLWKGNPVRSKEVVE